MKLKFDKKNISLFLFVGFSLALISVIIYPLIEKIKENSQKLIKTREEIASFREEKQNLKNFEGVYKKISSDLKQSENLFFTKEKPAEFEFINYLEQVASGHDILIKISSVDEQKNQENNLSFLTVNLNASGVFNDFFKFIEKLESSPYLIEIDELSIKKSTKDNSSESIIETSISLRILD